MRLRTQQSFSKRPRLHSRSQQTEPTFSSMGFSWGTNEKKPQETIHDADTHGVQHRKAPEPTRDLARLSCIYMSGLQTGKDSVTYFLRQECQPLTNLTAFILSVYKIQHILLHIYTHSRKGPLTSQGDVAH